MSFHEGLGVLGNLIIKVSGCSQWSLLLPADTSLVQSEEKVFNLSSEKSFGKSFFSCVDMGAKAVPLDILTGEVSRGP